MSEEYGLNYGPLLERKFCRISEQLEIGADATISGYASLFDQTDQGGDVVLKGAYGSSLGRLKDAGISVKLLWQHDPLQPIGVWDDVHEDERGLYVKGRLLTDTQRGHEAAVLIRAGAIDGLSIGYRTVKAERDKGGQRLLSELELWEVSLVTFPMLSQARVGAKSDEAAPNILADPGTGQDLAGVIRTLRRSLNPDA